jgi:hypothetical protein
MERTVRIRGYSFHNINERFLSVTAGHSDLNERQALNFNKMRAKEQFRMRDAGLAGRICVIPSAHTGMAVRGDLCHSLPLSGTATMWVIMGHWGRKSHFPCRR